MTLSPWRTLQIQTQKCEPCLTNQPYPFLQEAFHLTQPHPHSRKRLTVMPWTTTNEFNVIPKTQQMSLASFPFYRWLWMSLLTCCLPQWFNSYSFLLLTKNIYNTPTFVSQKFIRKLKYRFQLFNWRFVHSKLQAVTHRRRAYPKVVQIKIWKNSRLHQLLQRGTYRRLPTRIQTQGSSRFGWFSQIQVTWFSCEFKKNKFAAIVLFQTVHSDDSDGKWWRRFRRQEWGWSCWWLFAKCV